MSSRTRSKTATARMNEGYFPPGTIRGQKLANAVADGSDLHMTQDANIPKHIADGGNSFHYSYADVPVPVAQVARAQARNWRAIEVLPGCLPGKVRHIFGERMANAHIYNFDHALSEHANKLSLDWVSVMAPLMPRIRLPYPNVILSYPASVHDDKATPGMRLLDFCYQSNDTTIRVLPIMLDPDNHGIVLWPHSYVITAEPSGVLSKYEMEVGANIISVLVGNDAANEEALLKHPKDTIAGCVMWHLLGRTAMVKYGGISDKDFTAVTHYFGIRPAPYWSVAHEMSNRTLYAWSAMLVETNGHLRVTAALLLLLNVSNRITGTIWQERKPGTFRYKSKNYPYFSEHSVRLLLPEKKLYRAIRTEAAIETGIRHRRHEVQGHWCCNGPNDKCHHPDAELCTRGEWVSLDQDHSQCVKCLRNTWRRKHHERGDASLGWVRKTTYEVEKRQ